MSSISSRDWSRRLLQTTRRYGRPASAMANARDCAGWCAGNCASTSVERCGPDKRPAASEHTNRSEVSGAEPCPSTRLNSALARDTTRLRSLRSRVEWWRRRELQTLSRSFTVLREPAKPPHTQRRRRRMAGDLVRRVRQTPCRECAGPPRCVARHRIAGYERTHRAPGPVLPIQ